MYPSRWGRRAQVHLQDGFCLRIRLVLGVLANDGDLIPDRTPWLVAASARARLLARRHPGARRDRLRHTVGRDMHELPDAGELGVNECERPLVNVASDTCSFGVRRLLPGGELRLHGGVADLPAEAWRLHPVQAAVSGEQQDDDVDSSERRDGQRRPPNSGSTEIQDRPVAGGGIVRQPAALQPHSQGNQQQAENEDNGDEDENDQAGYGFSSRPVKAAIVSATKTTADAVVMTAPAMATGCRTSASSRCTSALFQAAQIRHQAVDVGGWELAVLVRHRRLLGGWTSSSSPWDDDPRPYLVGAELLPDAVERVRLAPLPAMEWQVWHFCAA